MAQPARVSSYDGSRAMPFSFFVNCLRRLHTMLIAYDSKTGNVKRFINKLKLPAVQIEEQMTIEEPYVLITYTTGFGQIPERVSSFLKKNAQNLVGVAASGNRNWGEKFAKSADLISDHYNVPVISKFELSGTFGDVERFKQEVSRVAAY
jgi:protein involved in ribonucleotide reduction